MVPGDPYSLLGVPNCFVTSQQIKIWRDSDYRDNEDVIRWYSEYKKREPQKSQSLNKWCIPEDKKRLWK